MKKVIAVVLLLLSQASPAFAVPENEVSFVVSYTEGFLYCNNSIGLKDYLNGQIYTNDAACLDTSDLILNNSTDWYTMILQQYPGGIHRWMIHADGKHCTFDVYQASPVYNQFTAYEIVFAACAVKLNKPVTSTWYMTDYEDPSISDIYLEADLLAPVNQAVVELSTKFRKPFKVWLKPNGSGISVTVATSPAGSKLFLQKWVDYKWVTVKTIERYWEPKTEYLYKFGSGKYRVYGKSLSGVKYISKALVV